MGRWLSKDLAVDLAFNLGLVLIGALVVQVTSWDRLTVYLAALAIGWTIRFVVQRRRAPRPDRAPEGAEPEGVRR